MVMIRLILLNIFLFQTASASAPSEIITLLDKKTEDIFTKGKVFFPRVISLVKMQKNKMKGIPLKNFEQLSHLHIFDGKTFNWSWLMNGFQYQKLRPQDAFYKAFQMTGADALLLANKKKWDLLVLNEQKAVSIYQMNKPRKINKKSFNSWITKAFGYNAMMIAYHDGLYYIKGFDSLKKGDQGVVFKESSDVLMIDKEEIIGIIEVSHTVGTYGVGKAILGSFLNLEEGAKLKIISKNHVE